MSILNPGDVKVTFLRVYNGDGKFVDIKNIFVKLTIYEDIMSCFTSGEIILTDSSALQSLLPFVGEERLDISFETPGHEGDEFKFTGSFHVYKISAIENFKTKNATMVLNFISIDGFVDMNTRISQTFRGAISDTVVKLLKSSQYLNTAKTPIVERTTSNSTHTSNFWTPSQNIFYLAGEAYNSNSNPNYVFYENRDGFNFVSMDTLYEQRPLIEFIKDEKNRDNDSQGKSVPNTGEAYRRVLDMSTQNFYDYIDRLQTGMYGSAMYHYDVETRRLRFMQRNSKYDYKSTTLNEMPSINQGTVFLPVSKLMTTINHRSLYPNTVTTPFDKDMKRAALLKRSDAFKTAIRVFGRANYKVGDVVDLKIYANKEVTDKTPVDQLLDPLLSGKYLISTLSHEITAEAHYCNIELIRDSYTK